MINTKSRLFVLMASLLLLASVGSAVADQKIKTKSNIKNDRLPAASASLASSSASNSSTPAEKSADAR